MMLRGCVERAMWRGMVCLVERGVFEMKPCLLLLRVRVLRNTGRLRFDNTLRGLGETGVGGAKGEAGSCDRDSAGKACRCGKGDFRTGVKSPPEVDAGEGKYVRKLADFLLSPAKGLDADTPKVSCRCGEVAGVQAISSSIRGKKISDSAGDDISLGDRNVGKVFNAYKSPRIGRGPGTLASSAVGEHVR